MLPDFPSLKLERSNRLLKLARARSKSKHGVLNLISGFVQREGDGVHLCDVEGSPSLTEYRHFHAEMEVHMDELPEMDDEAWIKKFAELTDHFANESEKRLIECIGEATTATGNVVHTKGEPISEKHILEMFEKLQLDFVDGEIAPGVAFLTSPSLAAKLANMDSSDELKEQYDEIIQRKLLEWRLREADRKLVD